MLNSKIHSLNDLNNFRSAPELNQGQSRDLKRELQIYTEKADWFTIGIMAPSSSIAIKILRQVEAYYSWQAMKVVKEPSQNGPVFLKANQTTGDIYVRIEHGLGEGILISCQHNEEQKETYTFGPFPLNFFNIEN